MVNLARRGMSKGELLQLARQGDPEAIATLLNYTLQHKQIRTEVSLEGGCLDIILYAPQLPEPKAALVLIDRELMRLKIPGITIITVRGPSLNPDQPTWEEEFTLGKRAYSNSPHPQPKAITLEVKSVSKEGWRALITGLVLSIILVVVSPLKLMFYGFSILVHELGHTITNWLFGRPAIPTVDLLYGGGLTIVFDQSVIVIGLVYVALGTLFYLCRFYPRLQGFLVLLAGIYTCCLFSPMNRILSTAMGHGMEVTAIMVCLYLSTSGYFCRMAGDRSIYAMLGFFTLFVDLQFAWKLIYDSDFRDWYLEGKGGVLDNDFTILANDYFHVNLSVVAGCLLVSCLLAPLVAFILFRYEQVWNKWVDGLISS